MANHIRKFMANHIGKFMAIGKARGQDFRLSQRGDWYGKKISLATDNQSKDIIAH